MKRHYRIYNSECSDKNWDKAFGKKNIIHRIIHSWRFKYKKIFKKS